MLGDELRRSVKSNDRVFIFFAGHGQTESLPEGGQEGYLIPVDGDGDHLFSTCISMTTVRGFSDRLEAKHVFYAIDACYSGMALTRSGSMRGGDRLYLDRVARFRARQIVTAGRAGEQVVERGGHGIFTLALLMALDGNADKYAPFGIPSWARISPRPLGRNRERRKRLNSGVSRRERGNFCFTCRATCQTNAPSRRQKMAELLWGISR